jgi:hemolysin activation/secretion protein
MVFKRKSLQSAWGSYFTIRVGVILLGAGMYTLLPTPAQAQTSAGEEMAGANSPELLRLPRTAAHTVIRAQMPERSVQTEPVKISIEGFEVEGHPEISEEKLTELLLPLKGEELTLPEFEERIHAVANYLRENGNPNATVSISKARLREGIVAMVIDGLNPRPAEKAPATVQVNNFNVTGTTLASSEEYDALLAPWKDEPMTFEQLQQLPVQVAGLLRGKGYVLAQAWLPPQRVDDGTLEIAVIDGKVDGTLNSGGVVVEGAAARVSPQMVKRFVAEGVSPDEPIMVSDLDKSLRLLDELPGVASVNSTLIPGSRPGTTQVQVNVDEANLLSGSVWADNYGGVYTGRNQLSAHIDLNSPSGHGEQYNLDLSKSSGMQLVKIGGSMPVGARGTRIGLSASSMTLDIDPTMVPINLNSESTVVSLFANVPMARSETYNNTLSGFWEFKHHENVTPDFKLDDRKISMGTVAWVGNAVDSKGGVMAWNAGGSFGWLDLSGEPGYQAVDAATANSEGTFARANWELARRARINYGNWSYYTAFKGQLANKNLDGAEKFQLGGPAGVRAYPVGEGLGDNGWLLTAELRHSLGTSRLGEASLFGFADMGGVTQYADPWSGSLGAGQPNTYSLKGAGIGATISGQHASLSVSAAHKLGDNPNPTTNNNDADGTNDPVRIWVIGNIEF